MEALKCICCGDNLIEIENKLNCLQCKSTFSKNKYGFFQFTTTRFDEDITLVKEYEEYAKTQNDCHTRAYDGYLRAYLFKESFSRVLDVGCGICK